MNIEKTVMELQAEVLALKKMSLQEWTEMKRELLNITQRQNELAQAVNRLLKEAALMK